MAAAEPMGRARRAWKALPAPVWLRNLATWIFYRIAPKARAAAEAEAMAAFWAERRPRPANEITPGRLVVSGLLSDVSGIARAGRLSLAAFRAAGLDPIVHDWRREPQGWGERPEGGVWFGHYNAPEAEYFLAHSEGPRDCYRVGYWAWELPNLPASWAKTAGLFHELWAPSTFVADTLRRGTEGVVVRCVPHPLPELTGVRPDRGRFGLPDGVFAFLAMYDVKSSATRKNPLGAVRAFQRAFAPDRADVRLLLKVVADDETPDLAELRATTEGWANIALVVERLTDAETSALIAAADAFVSLHRAEGFGLSIAEAMALGRPVIVTDWSGNVDFCQQGAINVGYRLIPVDDPTAIYGGEGQVWADPELEEAAAAMRRLADNPTSARSLGEAAREHIHRVLPKAYDIAPLRPWLA